ncbi:N-acetylmuramidase family protein [Chloroflexi bacterium TSY]|nr:N-acetylmuramidase family protein [Chloroflexi bacterium TSY]
MQHETTVRILAKVDEWLFLHVDPKVAGVEAPIAGYGHQDFVTRGATNGTMPTGPRTKFLRTDPSLRTIGLEAIGGERIILGSGAGSGARRLADIWNRYGGLLARLADQLGLDPAVAIAVLAVESGGGGFQDGRLIIRFENHLFYDEWGRFNQARFFQHFAFHQEVSWQGHTWRARSDQPFQEFHGNQQREHQVFNFALTLDETAAKRSISMGAPQILGRNHERIGYRTVEEMFQAFAEDERSHILGLFDFIRTDTRLVRSLRHKDYVTFAAGYNGTGQAETYGRLIAQNVQAFERLRVMPALSPGGAATDAGPLLESELDNAISCDPLIQAPDAQIRVNLDVSTPIAMSLPLPIDPEFGPDIPNRESIDPELIAIWRSHIEQGLENNTVMFQRVLRAFMLPYYLTVVMYVALFLVGVGLFVIAAWLTGRPDTEIGVAFFGGLGVLTFLAFFVSKPLRSLEENLQFITWLGIIYNTYWTRLLYMQDNATVQADLEDATNDAITEINRLLDKSAEMNKQRPNLGTR